MQKEEIALLRPGDFIAYRTKALTPCGLVDAGRKMSEVTGTTDGAALIDSETHPALIIAIQAHNIVTAYRMVERGVIAFYTANTPKEA